MSHLIRKITIGKDYKNDAMHYSVGQEVYGGHTICDILEETEKKEFLKDLNLEESGLNRLIKTGFSLLDLITFFTVGPKETRAWTIKNNSTAPEAAGIIHTDFQKGFIRAETISYDDYLNFKSEQAAKDAGRMRVEGADYMVKDGDVFHFRFNV